MAFHDFVKYLAHHPTYRYVKSLGHGAFGSLLLCQHEATSELVAIKFIERGANASKDVEAGVLEHRWLRHPHVVGFREIFLTPRHICIVTEYANGGTMFKQVSSAGQLKESAARWLFQQLMIALDYCHRPGKVKPSVSNRDIRLENILLQNMGGGLPLVKLCDFSYSKQSFVPKEEVGDLRYMAPEVVRGEKYDAEKADIWSCGVTLYAMLAGRYPFTIPPLAEQGDHSSRTQRLTKRILNNDWHLRLPQEIADKLSPGCKDLLSQLLAADPAQRISMPAIMQHPWFLASLPPAALLLNEQCLGIEDYGGVQPEAEIRAICRRHFDSFVPTVTLKWRRGGARQRR